MVNNPRERVVTLTTTLFAQGFLLESTRRVADALLMTYTREDEFGVKIPYLVALAENRLEEPALEAIRLVADREAAHLVIIGETSSASEVPVLSFDQFLARFGGGIRSLLPLEETFSEQLNQLGHNQVPPGLRGTADELFEVYVEAGLQFLLGRRIVRYGQERRGESVPDGVAVRQGGYILYDAKAAKDGYEVTAAAIRQFSKYVNDFHNRYLQLFGRAYVFLVVSGSFANDSNSLIARSQELYAQTGGVSLVFLDAGTLGDVVAYFSQHLQLREATDWNLVFANPIIKASTIKGIAEAAGRDGLLGR